MRPPPKSAIRSVILAGGQGRRLGNRDKARLIWRGRMLSRRLKQDLRQQSRHCSINRRRLRSRLHGLAVTQDASDLNGPVAGLQAGLKQGRQAWRLFCPVDSLNMPHDLVRQLALGSQRGGYARHQGNDYYLHALIPRRARQQLADFIAADGRSASNACRAMNINAVEVQSPDTVWSINTPAQWRRIHRQRLR